ncbi:MAG: PKD domain-containing protein [Chloroherpetonaceae bacterium]|nr:PKD domain-containing protein [Chloroherpetonaceae bacterium]
MLRSSLFVSPIKNRLLLLLLALQFFGVHAAAQEVFMSISGTTASTISGVDERQYDYWFKPSQTANNATIRIFDAGISKNSFDVIYGAMDTRTTFSLYRFSDLYEITPEGVRPKPDSLVKASPLKVLTVADEQQYRNRWAEFSRISKGDSPEGFIVRASTKDGGNDVNAFRIISTEANSLSAQSPNWRLVTINLSVALIELPNTFEAQFLPYTEGYSEYPKPTTFAVVGEEGAIVTLKDEFGKNASPKNPGDFWIPEVSGEKNRWGLSISKSKVNNHLSILSTSGFPMLWEFTPKLFKVQSEPPLRVIELPGKECNEVRFQIAPETKRGIGNAVPIWVFDAEKRTGDSTEFSFKESGDYNVSIWIPSSGIYFPKYWVRKFTTHVNAPPKSVISVSKNILSPNESLLFTSERSYDPEGKPLRFIWTVDGVPRGNSSEFRFQTSIPGKYAIGLTVVDDAKNSSCITNTSTAEVVVNSQPFTEIEFPAEFARKETQTFSAKNAYDPDNHPLNYLWSGKGVDPQNNSSSQADVYHEEHGYYDAALTVDDGTGTLNATYTKSVRYRVNAEPLPKFTLTELAAPNDKIVISASATTDADDRNLIYTWEVSDGRDFEGRDISLTFTSPGDYTVELSVDDGHNVSNSIQSLTKNIHINFPPVPVITAESQSTSAKQEFSASETVDKDDETLRYTWDFGDGTRGEGMDVTHLYQRNGTFKVTLTVDDGRRQTNSVQRISHEIEILRYPIAEFTIPDFGEPGKPVQVDASRSYAPSGDIESITWYIDGVQVADGKTALLTITEPGDHTITVVVKDNTGFEDAKSSKSKMVHINYPPTPEFTVSSEVFAPKDLISFDASSSSDNEGRIKAYMWRFSDGTVLNGPKVKKSFNKSGIVEFTLTVDDGSGFNNSIQQKSGRVLVNSTPILVSQSYIKTNSSRILLDASRSYDIDNHAINFEWVLPNGEKRSGASFFWDAPSGGVHFVSLNIDDGQGLSNSRVRETIKIVINRPPVAIVDSLVTACTGQTILFSGSRCFDPDADALKLTWDFGDGTQSSETNPAKTYKLPGQYSVKIFISDGFADQPTLAVIPVKIGGSPIAIQRFTDTTVCVQSLITFDGSLSFYPGGTIGSYAWDFGDGETALGKTVQHLYSKPGKYSVVLTVIGENALTGTSRCSRISQTNATVYVVSGPVAEIAINSWVAPGDTLMMDSSPSQSGDGKIVSIEWIIGADTNSTAYDSLATAPIKKQGEKIEHIFKKPGIYPVTLFIASNATTNCRTSSITKYVRVNYAPVIVWRLPKSIPLGEPLILDASQSKDPDGIIMGFEWKLDGRVIGTTPILQYTITAPGNHTIELKVYDDSPTRSKSSVVSNTIYVNAPSRPEMIVPSPIYAQETVPLRIKTSTRQKATSYAWLVNNTPVTDSTYQFPAGRHIITLISDDGLGLSNSIDSVRQEVFVTPAPLLEASLPRYLNKGAKLSFKKYSRERFSGFVNDDKLDSVYIAKEVGEVSITLGWKPKTEILATRVYSATVFDSLSFTESPETLVLTWNPANPSTLVSAPKINRVGNWNVSYKWFNSAKKLVGYGKMAEVPLLKGLNTFTVEATEQGVFGSVKSRAVVKVKTE